MSAKETKDGQGVEPEWEQMVPLIEPPLAQAHDHDPIDLSLRGQLTDFADTVLSPRPRGSIEGEQIWEDTVASWRAERQKQ